MPKPLPKPEPIPISNSNNDLPKQTQNISVSSQKQRNRLNTINDSMNTVNNLPDHDNKYSNKYKFGIIIGLIAYLLLGRVLGFIHSITEIVVFSVLPIKIVLHVMCNQNESQKYNNYSNVLLKQMFLIVLIKTLISFIPFLDLIPIVRIISYPVYLILILSAIVIQVPVTMLNKMIGFIFDKIKLSKISSYIHVNPVYDKLILRITNMFDDSKIARLRIIRNIFLKYESDVPWNPKDVNKMSSAMNDLGINQIVDNIGINQIVDNIDIKSSFNGIIKQLN